MRSSSTAVVVVVAEAAAAVTASSWPPSRSRSLFSLKINDTRRRHEDGESAKVDFSGQMWRRQCVTQIHHRILASSPWLASSKNSAAALCTLPTYLARSLVRPFAHQPASPPKRAPSQTPSCVFRGGKSVRSLVRFKSGKFYRAGRKMILLRIRVRAPATIRADLLVANQHKPWPASRPDDRRQPGRDPAGCRRRLRSPAHRPTGGQARTSSVRRSSRGHHYRRWPDSVNSQSLERPSVLRAGDQSRDPKLMAPEIGGRQSVTNRRRAGQRARRCDRQTVAAVPGGRWAQCKSSASGPGRSYPRAHMHAQSRAAVVGRRRRRRPKLLA